MAKAAAPAKTIKICLTNRGADSETPWAQDLGPAPGIKGGRKVRLVNVPFLHAKPTWGDVVVVSPAQDGMPTWDRQGVPWKNIATRIVEDGGRWAMIVDYVPPAADASGDAAFRALSAACQELDVVCEGAFGPRNGSPGRAYLAATNARSADDVMQRLAAARLPCDLAQIHPAPENVRPIKSERVKAVKAVAKPEKSKPTKGKGAPAAAKKPAAKAKPASAARKKR